MFRLFRFIKRTIKGGLFLCLAAAIIGVSAYSCKNTSDTDVNNETVTEDVTATESGMN